MRKAIVLTVLAILMSIGALEIAANVAEMVLRARMLPTNSEVVDGGQIVQP